jgi:hypothetical protein
LEQTREALAEATGKANKRKTRLGQVRELSEATLAKVKRYTDNFKQVGSAKGDLDFNPEPAPKVTERRDLSKYGRKKRP